MLLKYCLFIEPWPFLMSGPIVPEIAHLLWNITEDARIEVLRRFTPKK